MEAAFEVIDHARFRRYTTYDRIELLYTGTRWGEGPVWFADARCLLWSDIPNDRILRWVEGQGVSVFRQPSNMANGNTRDRQGRLITYEHGARCVTRTEPDGTITVLADRYQGRRLNSPNDVVVKSDDTIWFTDPDYGILSDFTGNRGESELDGRCNVYRLDPRTGELRIVVDDMVKPNGLSFSPDESILYVADTGVSHVRNGPHHIRAYDVTAEARCANGRLFADINPGAADGFRMDMDGNVWSTAADGVQVFAPDGALIGRLRMSERSVNLTFGGPKRNRLFIATGTSLCAIYTGAQGAQRP
jgi:gluconolactonase